MPLGVHELYSCGLLVLCFHRCSFTDGLLSRYCRSSFACERGWCVCRAVMICERCMRVLVCEYGSASAIVSCLEDDVP